MLVETSDLVSVTELGRGLSRYINEAAATGRRFVILNANTPTAALVSIEDLERLHCIDTPPSPSPEPAPQLEQPAQSDLEPRPGFTAIGRDTTGETVYWSLTEHHLAAGQLGGGLSLCLSAAIAATTPAADVRTEFVVATGGPHVSLRHQRIHPDIPIAVHADLRDLAARQQFIETLNTEIEWRHSLLRQHQVDTIAELRQLKGDNTPPEVANLVIVLADAIDIIEPTANRTPIDLAPLLQVGAALGVYLWLGAPLTASPPFQAVVSQIPSRVLIGGVDTESVSLKILGATVAAHSTVPDGIGWTRTDRQFAVTAPAHGPGTVVTAGGRCTAWRPWLQQPLALGDIPATPDDPNASGLTIPIGVTNPPWEALNLSLDDATPFTCIIAAKSTGATTLLQTVVASAGLRYTPQQCAFLLLDAGGGQLAEIATQPNVAGYARLGDDNVDRLLGEALRIIRIRKSELAAKKFPTLAAHLASRSRATAEDPYQHLVVLIDGIDAFSGDDVDSLLDHGARFGVHVIATTSKEPLRRRHQSPEAFPIRMAHSGDSPLSREHRQLEARIPIDQPGRCIDLARSRNARIALPYPGHYSDTTDDHQTRLAQLAHSRAGGEPITPVAAVPTRIDPGDFWAQVDATRGATHADGPTKRPATQFPLGVDIATGQVVDIPAGARHLVIIGDPGSGRAATLHGISAAISHRFSPDGRDGRPAAAVLVIDEHGQLDEVRDHLAQEKYLLTEAKAPVAAVEALTEFLDEHATARAATRRPEVFVLINRPAQLYRAHVGQRLDDPVSTRLIDAIHRNHVHVYLTDKALGYATRRLTSPLLQALANSPHLLLSGPRAEGVIWPGTGICFAPRHPGRGQLVDPTSTMSKIVQIPWYSPPFVTNS